MILLFLEVSQGKMACEAGGMHLEWNARTTKLVPNKAIAWESEPGAKIGHTGKIHFESTGSNSTLHKTYRSAVLFKMPDSAARFLPSFAILQAARIIHIRGKVCDVADCKLAAPA